MIDFFVYTCYNSYNALSIRLKASSRSKVVKMSDTAFFLSSVSAAGTACLVFLGVLSLLKKMRPWLTALAFSAATFGGLLMLIMIADRLPGR